ncbi:glycosyltransferase [Cellulomonas sp. ATA003]|uniref:glycosyltransferase n=1 Tax=Cellulomonas sp. ATA003 TaxID=3073064 RepID=UPI0028737289|nr:glycosyltransferase [Cellulomonas sp. ATA003]WNB85442.1 glycosyltransferase [Cellulomonas sp. ATA003]
MAQVALAHDYLTQRGGAERVALTLTEAFPGSPLHTSLFEPSRTFTGFRGVTIRTSPLQRVAPFRRDARLALPFLAKAWERTVVDDADVVLASSTGWAHGLRATPGVPVVVYCHNPARWLYQSAEYDASAVRRAVTAPLRSRLLQWDQAAAQRAHTYLANSTVVAKRIRDAYGLEATVVHPPVSVDTRGPQQPVPGLAPGFWLSIARGRGYKNVQQVIDAVARIPGEELVVVGSAPPGAASIPNVRWLGIVSEARLRWLYANARALVSVAREDFGLTPIEANAFGTPVAVLRGGGFLDSTDEGRSGVFIDEATSDAVEAALRDFPVFDAQAVVTNAARFSAEAFATRVRSVVQGVLQH